jgi:hypothetical protein
MGLFAAEEITMRLKVMIETLAARPRRLAFQCDNDQQNIVGSISVDTLRDMMDFHRVKGGPEDVFRALLPEIERLVNAKYDSGRFDENGELSICTAEILRYGFREREKFAA